MKKITLSLLVGLGLAVVVGIGVLIWWFVRSENINEYETIRKSK